MNRIDRLFGILMLLQSRKYVTADAIADKFEMSVRTVYRDIKALSEQGVPISFEPHRGYCIVYGFFLPPVSFTTDEANALLLMEPMIQNMADKSIQKHYSNAVMKIRSVLRSDDKEVVPAVSQSVITQFPQRLSNETQHLSSIQQAISSQRIISIAYKNNKDETSERAVEPIGLIFYAFGWHLIGWCHLRNDYRDFKVTRIATLDCTRTPFSKSDHLPLAEFMKTLPVSW